MDQRTNGDRRLSVQPQTMPCLDHSERIVALETELLVIKQNQSEQLRMLGEILTEMNRYKGFMGGIAFLTSGALIAWNVLGDWIKAHWN